jgi:hypothetical protein
MKIVGIGTPDGSVLTSTNPLRTETPASGVSLVSRTVPPTVIGDVGAVWLGAATESFAPPQASRPQNAVRGITAISERINFPLTG